MKRKTTPKLIDPPEPRPTVTVSLPWTKVEDSRWNRGSLLFEFQDTLVDVSDDAGHKLGWVAGAMGGFLQIHIIQNEAGGFETWRLDPRDVWRLFTEAKRP